MFLGLQSLKLIGISSIVFALVCVFLCFFILLVKKYLLSSKPCKIKINDDDSLIKIVPEGISLLNALQNEGIGIPSPCGGKATCKQCKLQITDGVGTPLDIDKSTFSKKQLNSGWRLSCQYKIHHDLSVLVEERYLTASTWTGTVVSNANVATFIKELVIKLNDSSVIPYKPGGYLQICVPPFTTNTSDWKSTMDSLYYSDWEKLDIFNRKIDFSMLTPNADSRAYSLASYPKEAPFLKFNIRIAIPPMKDNRIQENIPWGLCSSYLFSRKPGDFITMTGPYGESFMQDNIKPLIFLIGGAGSSFGRSHISDLLKDKHSQRDISLWYGARSLKENIYGQDYLELEKEFPNFHYHLVLSEPLPEDIADGWDINNPIKTNFLFKAFELGQLKLLENPEDYLFYVCGPPMHNKSILKLLEDYGVPRSSIILDDFGS
ncbi:MAG: NADH:ubiquinone reductase (Na(+)-transporting) subunit F [Victivallaceae bacterium]